MLWSGIAYAMSWVLRRRFPAYDRLAYSGRWISFALICVLVVAAIVWAIFA